MSLIDRARASRGAAAVGPNPQTGHGADVLSRLAAAQDPAVAAGIAEQTAATIGAGIRFLLDRHPVPPPQRLVLVGNTAMLALLANRGHARLLDPDQWGVFIDCRPSSTAGWRRRWHLAPSAGIRLVPSLAGFVGSDLTAGVLASGLTGRRQPHLLVDFGTNTEIALWDGRRLWVTAAAGGPAFEGSGVSCGMAADPGAVFRIDQAGRVQVIGGGAALGLCGSGLVDAIARLRSSGHIDAVGRVTGIDPKAGCPVSAGCPHIRLHGRDIDAFQRAKAAVAAGIDCLLDKAGIGVADLERVLVTGAFGQGLDGGNAAGIGLLPASRGGTQALPDLPLQGAERMVCGARLAGPSRRALVINLSAVPGYEDRFIHRLRLDSF